MQQPQSKVVPPLSGRAKSNSIVPSRSIDKLNAEMLHNHRRIEHLHERNALLAQQLAELEAQPPQPNSDSSHRQVLDPAIRQSPRLGQRNRPTRKSQRVLAIRQWLVIGLIVLCIATICATIGFAIARSIALR